MSKSEYRRLASQSSPQDALENAISEIQYLRDALALLWNATWMHVLPGTDLAVTVRKALEKR